jgi:hypothetical protein
MLVLVETCILFAGVVSRYVFNSPIIGTDELATFLFLRFAMMGAVVAVRRDGHMRLTTFVNWCDPKWANWLGTVAGLVVIVDRSVLLGHIGPSCLPVAARLTAFAASSPFCLTLSRCALRHQAILKKLPKRNRQSSGKRDDADLAAAHTGAGEPLPPPGRQGALGLVAQPRPSQLDQRLSRELGPGRADTTIPANVADRVRRRGQPNERRQVSSALEAALIDLGN